MQYDEVLSKRIFLQLMNGKVINKTILSNSGDFIPNPLFTEITKNLDVYRMQYSMSGFELIEKQDYVFITDCDTNEINLKTDITMKAYVLLSTIGKYINENYKLERILDPNCGLTEADIEAIQEMPDITEILERSSIKDFKSGLKNILIDRNIMLQKPGTNQYILSSAGAEFFQEICT